jgi:hypothetical protein
MRHEASRLPFFQALARGSLCDVARGSRGFLLDLSSSHPSIRIGSSLTPFLPKELVVSKDPEKDRREAPVRLDWEDGTRMSASPRLACTSQDPISTRMHLQWLLSGKRLEEAD